MKVIYLFLWRWGEGGEWAWKLPHNPFPWFPWYPHFISKLSFSHHENKATRAGGHKINLCLLKGYPKKVRKQVRPRGCWSWEIKQVELSLKQDREKNISMRNCRWKPTEFSPSRQRRDGESEKSKDSKATPWNAHVSSHLLSFRSLLSLCVFFWNRPSVMSTEISRHSAVHQPGSHYPYLWFTSEKRLMGDFPCQRKGGGPWGLTQ